jgi:hypothetical protein
MLELRMLTRVAAALAGLLCLLALSAPAVAVPITYGFRVDGFPEGAYLEGQFTGEDLNGDGSIKRSWNSDLPFEITSFSVGYFGDPNAPTIIPLGLTSLGAHCFFDTQTFGLTFDTETIVSTNPFRLGGLSHQYVSYFDPSVPWGYVSVTTTQVPRVWVVTADPSAQTLAVPEAGSSLALLALGLALPMIARARGKRNGQCMQPR